MAHLVVNCEGVGSVTHDFAGNIVMIGRAPSNIIVIDHPTVSVQHAVLLRVRDSYSLKDLNSANGTQINGDFVTHNRLRSRLRQDRRTRCRQLIKSRVDLTRLHLLKTCCEPEILSHHHPSDLFGDVGFACFETSAMRRNWVTDEVTLRRC
jgi:hypothetical protein